MLREEAEKESGIESESDPEFNEYSAKTPTSPNEVVRRKKKKNMTTGDVFSQLAKRQSFQHVDFGADDIDAFIASVTVPPPPKDDPEGLPLPTLTDPPKPKLSLSTERSSSVRKSLQFGPEKTGKDKKTLPLKATAIDKTVQDDYSDEMGLDKWFAKHDMDIAHLDEDIAKLIMPPPMSESVELTVSDIPIVPPVASNRSSTIEASQRQKQLPPPPLSEKPKYVPNQVSDMKVKDKTQVSQRNSGSPGLEDKSEKGQGSFHSGIPKRTSSPLGRASPLDKSENKRASTEGSPEHAVKHRIPQSNISSKISEVKKKLEGVMGTDSDQSVKVDKVEGSSHTAQILQRSASQDANTQSPSKMDKYEGIKGHLVKQLSANIQGRGSPTFEQGSSPKKSEKSTSEASPQSVVIMREKHRESSLSPGPQRRHVASEGAERLSGSPKSGRKGRPMNAPPPPPVGEGLPYKRSVSTSDAVNQKRKAPPPAPPKRFSSLDSSSDSPAENSKTVILIPKENILSTSSTSSRGLQKSTIGSHVKDDAIVSKSLDSSPLHVPIKLVHSIGTMPRFRKKPPMPPPRRSSALDGQYNEMPELTRSSEHIMPERPKFSTFGPSVGRNITGSSHSQSNSESSIFTMFRDKPLSSAQNKNKDTAGRQFTKPATGKLSVGKTISDSSYFDKNTAETTRPTRRDSDSSDSGSPKASRSKTYVSPSIQAKQNAIATALTRQTSQAGDIVDESGIKTNQGAIKQTDTPPRSPGVGRSSTFTKSSTIPKAYVSPQTSPALHRHSSFSKAADKNPAPFKTFLGDSGGVGTKDRADGSKVDPAAHKIHHGYQVQAKIYLNAKNRYYCVIIALKRLM